MLTKRKRRLARGRNAIMHGAFSIPTAVGVRPRMLNSGVIRLVVLTQISVCSCFPQRDSVVAQRGKRNNWCTFALAHNSRLCLFVGIHGRVDGRRLLLLPCDLCLPKTCRAARLAYAASGAAVGCIRCVAVGVGSRSAESRLWQMRSRDVARLTGAFGECLSLHGRFGDYCAMSVLQCILLHASLTVARLVFRRGHWRRHVAVACISCIEVALTCLAQRPATARQCWQSRGWLEPRWAHVFELRLRALHCEGGARRACNV